MPELPASDFSPSALLFIVLVLAVSGFLMWRSQRSIATGRNASTVNRNMSDPRAGTARLAPPKEVESWQVDTHELVRDWTAQLDNKIRILDQLIREANATIARLEAVSTTGLPPVPAPAPTTLAPRSATPADDDRGHAHQAAGLAAASTTRPSEADTATWSGAAPKRSAIERQMEVYKLADTGLAPSEIARQSGLPIGEIELILALRGKST